MRAAEKVSSPHFRSTHAESQQQHKKGKALTGIHANLSMWFYKVTCCKHLPKYTEPPAVQTRPGDRHCRLSHEPCFWGGTWIFINMMHQKTGKSIQKWKCLMVAPAMKCTCIWRTHILPTSGTTSALLRPGSHVGFSLFLHLLQWSPLEKLKHLLVFLALLQIWCDPGGGTWCVILSTTQKMQNLPAG